jgi:hypothetical protein
MEPDDTTVGLTKEELSEEEINEIIDLWYKYKEDN